MDNQEKNWSYKQDGIWVERLLNEHNIREVVFSEIWKKYNEDEKEVMSQPTLSVMIPDCTMRDAKIAATIIQWLGSNCGQGFLYEVQKALDKLVKIV